MEKIKSFFKDRDTIIAIIMVTFYAIVIKGLPNLFILILKNIFTEEQIIESNYAILVFLNVAIYLVLASLIIPLSIKYLKQSYIDCSNNTQIPAKQISIGIIAMYCTSILSSIVSSLLTSETSSNQDSINTLTSTTWGYLSLFLIIGFIGPVIEELIFRHAIFKILRNNTVSIIISSLLFGLIHVTFQSGKPLDVITISLPYVSAGIVYGCLYVKSNRNILIPIACHITNNAISLLIVAFSFGLIR